MTCFTIFTIQVQFMLFSGTLNPWGFSSKSQCSPRSPTDSPRNPRVHLVASSQAVRPAVICGWTSHAERICINTRSLGLTAFSHLKNETWLIQRIHFPLGNLFGPIFSGVCLLVFRIFFGKILLLVNRHTKDAIHPIGLPVFPHLAAERRLGERLKSPRRFGNKKHPSTS